MPKENATGAHTSRGSKNCTLYFGHNWSREAETKREKTVAVSNDTGNLADELSQDSAVSEEQPVEPPLGTLNAYLGVAFWIAFDTLLCTASDFENKLEKAFLQAGLNIYECKIVKPRSTKTKNVSDPVEYFTSALSQVIKDHNWPCAIDIAKESAINFVHNVFDRDFEPLQGTPMAKIDCDVHSVVPDDPRFSKRVVKIVIMKQCNPAVADELKRGLQKTRHTDFRYDIVDFTTTESDQSDHNSEQGIPLKGNSSLMQCVDIVNRAIKLEDYRLHRGKIYSKVPESKYSFINCCSIGAFLDTLVANPNFTDVLHFLLQILKG